MPIYDQSYKHWQGRMKDSPRTWFVIAANGIRLLWRRWIIILLIISLIPFLIKATQIYLVVVFGDQFSQFNEIAHELEVNASFFKNFMSNQLFFIYIMVILTGSGIISADKKYGALQLYFSKPVSKYDYLVGKLCVVGFFIALVSMLPAVILFLMKVLLEDNMNFLIANYWIIISLVVYYAVITVVLGGLMLALSSLGRGSRYAGISFISIIILSTILGKIFTGNPGAQLISVNSLLSQTGNHLLGVPDPALQSIWKIVLALVVIMALVAWTLRMQIKGTEVVK